MGDTKAVRKSDWRDGFLFLGNHLALDFLNTHPVQKGQAVSCSLIARLLRWFLTADLLSFRQATSLRQEWGESARAQHVVEAMRELRESLRFRVASHCWALYLNVSSLLPGAGGCSP